MLKKAIEIRESEGEEAVSVWLGSLSDEDKKQFFDELDKASETMHAAFSNFREAIIKTYETMFPHMKTIVEELSKILASDGESRRT